MYLCIYDILGVGDFDQSVVDVEQSRSVIRDLRI